MCIRDRHYQTAIDHCTLVTRSQDHSHCSTHVVQEELLPQIDDDIDTVLGLSVFNQYVRTAALNQQQAQKCHVSVFTTELFAHYLHNRCLSVTKCRLLTQASTTATQRCQKCFGELSEMFATDVLLLKLVNRRKCPTNDHRQIVRSGQTKPVLSYQLDTSELVELLQQSAVEHLTAFRQLEAQKFSSVRAVVTTVFKALYVYKCGEYQHCLQLCVHNVRTLIDDHRMPCLCHLTYPEFIQLVDVDFVSLIGLMSIVKPSFRDDDVRIYWVHQLYLSLYLMTQCQIKLRHPLTSLAQTLYYVEVARRNLSVRNTLDQLLLKLTERKMLLYISGDCRELI